MELTREFFDELLGEEFDVRDDYSGRGMYGATCFALVGVTSDVLWFASYVTNWFVNPERTDGGGGYDWLWENVREDSMGRQAVYYWPSVTVEARESEGGDAA